MKTKITRKLGDYRPLVFKLDLTGYYNKTVSDIEDIIFVIKGDKSDLDNALFLKKLSDTDIIINSGTEIIEVEVKWLYDEYSNFNKKVEYLAGLYPKFIGEPIIDENTDSEFEIEFIDDMVKQD